MKVAKIGRVPRLQILAHIISYQYDVNLSAGFPAG